MADAIVIKDLHKSYGNTKALSGLSMNVAEGTVCGLIGPNGAGKSTTIRILLGLAAKDRGTVMLFGEEVVFGKELPSKRRIAYLPQDPVFPEKHTGEEILDLVGKLYGMDPRTLAFRQNMLLREFGLQTARKKNVAAYSRGMKQRLGLATCFLPEPDLLILDEPVSALDPEGRVEVFNILQELKGKSTVLFSSHILDDVQRVSDTLVMLKEGRKVVEGPIDDVLRKFAPERIRVRVRVEDTEKAMALASELPWAIGVSTDAGLGKGGEPGVLYLEVSPDNMEVALEETLSRLINGGIKVTEFGRVKADLESVFMKINT
ncbi:MAG TPA: ABC transporter ATP-binding protein [Firmicutes bacterium]|nr:ABC transporter ATP-binding protein [Candidatus Fermentithermobacillaceae bacterium]